MFLIDPFVVQFVLDGIKDRVYQLLDSVFLVESHIGNMIFSRF